MLMGHSSHHFGDLFEVMPIQNAAKEDAKPQLLLGARVSARWFQGIQICPICKQLVDVNEASMVSLSSGFQAALRGDGYVGEDITENV